MTNKGEVLVWGKTRDGALGSFPGGSINVATPSLLPYLNQLDSKVIDLDFSKEHGGLITEKGTLYTWGVDMHSKLGHKEDLASEGKTNMRKTMPKSTYDRIKFDKVDLNDKTVISVKCGYNHTLCLTSEGEVYSWGYNKEGSLGHANYDKPEVKLPTKIKYFQDNNIKIVKIESGDNFCLALDDSGKVFSWGKNEYGQLGLGHQSQQLKLSTPTEIKLTGKKVNHIFAGEDHAGCITEEGEAYLWGYGIDGRLGNKSKMNMNTPTKLKLSNIKKISCGGHHTAILTREGDLYMCGNGRDGELGRGDLLESQSSSRDEPSLVL